MLIEYEKLIDIFKGEKRISIYGCGGVGKALCKYQYASGFEQNIEEIIVTMKEPGIADFYGIPIVEPQNKRNDEIVIVATKSNLHEEIKQELSKIYFSEIYYLSDALCDYLLQETGGLYQNRMSLIPRKAIKFEVHLTEHCNLNCRGCFHFSPLANEEYLDVVEYKKDCERLAELYDGCATQILLLGGEPLLHPQIEDFIRITRDNFATSEIIIVTNGLVLSKMSESFWMSCKENNVYIEPTKYPVNANYRAAEAKAQQYEVELHYFNDAQEVKTLTYQPLDLKGQQNKEYNFYNCYRANLCITLSHGRLYTCIMPAHVHHFNDYFRAGLPDFVEDGIDIYKAKSAEEISNLLTHPIEMCKYCDRKNVKDGIEWSVSKKAKEEWI